MIQQNNVMLLNLDADLMSHPTIKRNYEETVANRQKYYLLMRLIKLDFPTPECPIMAKEMFTFLQ